jgi:hypothetical protein
LLAAALLVACGSAGEAIAPPWRASHPDPPGMTFDETAPGICAVTVQYPDLAPAAIDYLGNKYLQRSRTSPPSRPPGNVVGRSGGWVVSTSGGNLELDTGSWLFEYRPTTC